MADTSAEIDWAWVSGYDYYFAYLYNASGQQIGRKQVAYSRYTWTGLTPCTTYYGDATAFGAGKESAHSSRVQFRTTCPASGPLVPAHGALLGAWHKGASDWSTSGFTAFESMVGRQMDVDRRYNAWGAKSWPNSYDTWDHAHGRIPLTVLGGRSAFPGLDAVNNGSQDAWIAGRADAIKALGFPILFEPLHEMNGSWEPWGGYRNNTSGTTDGPAKYVKAWKRIHGIFVAHGATNAVWVWSPNCNDVPNAAWNHWTKYYPGDAYVDWVGCDGYNFGNSAYIEWADRYGGSPSIYSDYPQKPFSASETGSCERGTDKGAWIARAQSAIESRFPRLKLFTWFDEDKTAAGECDWRVNSSQGSLDAFRALAADPYFHGG